MLLAWSIGQQKPNNKIEAILSLVFCLSSWIGMAYVCGVLS